MNYNNKNVDIKEDTISNIIEFYGIKNPYPKLYLYNNKLNNSLESCSYVLGDQENSIVENMQQEITYISKALDSIDVIIFSNIYLNFQQVYQSVV